MKTYDYLIIGGGMTAAAAVDGIRELDPAGTIGIVGLERELPYKRPPLSKGLWQGEPLAGIWRKTDAMKVEFHLGRSVQEVDPIEKTAFDSHGEFYSYDKLLFATGGKPRLLPFGEGDILYYRTLSDYRRLRTLAEQRQTLGVIGGGFIGAEIAACLAANGKTVILLFPGASICARFLPAALSSFVSTYYAQHGVRVEAGETVEGLDRRGDRFVLRTATNREFEVDGIVAGIGVEPDIQLAQSVGLEIDDGIVVNEYLRTNQPDIYAAGDVASFHSAALGKRIRVEHEDNANTMGRIAGRNMAGGTDWYDHLPSFYSDLFDLGFEAVGDVDARLETFEDWKRPFEEGVVYFLEDRRVRGVLLWNVWGQLDAARELIKAKGPFTSRDLKDRLPLQTALRNATNHDTASGFAALPQ